jgi:ribosomal-protein-alanine N-acetyltransferase
MDEVQGYIMCRIENGFSKLKKFNLTKLCHIVSIAVSVLHRRRGIATVLIKKALEQGSMKYNASECYLEVRVSNHPAIELYEKLGFKKAKRNHGYYINGEDAWVMATPVLEGSKK